jgi:hypothetical protein
MSARLFLLQDEPTFVPVVLNVAERLLTDEALGRRLRDLRPHWRTAGKEAPIKFVAKNGPIARERIASLWINGTYFHNDDDAAKFKELFPDIGMPLARFWFENYILTVTQIVLFTQNVLSHAKAHGLLRVRDIAPSQ